MRFGAFIVDQLLENDDGVVKVCAGCQKEFNFAPPPNASHGYCKRHLILMQKDLIKHAVENGKMNYVQMAMKKLNEIKARPDTDFCPDMSQQSQAQPAGVAQ